MVSVHFEIIILLFFPFIVNIKTSTELNDTMCDLLRILLKRRVELGKLDCS